MDIIICTNYYIDKGVEPVATDHIYEWVNRSEDIKEGILMRHTMFTDTPTDIKIKIYPK